MKNLVLIFVAILAGAMDEPTLVPQHEEDISICERNVSGISCWPAEVRYTDGVVGGVRYNHDDECVEYTRSEGFASCTLPEGAAICEYRWDGQFECPETTREGE